MSLSAPSWDSRLADQQTLACGQRGCVSIRGCAIAVKPPSGTKSIAAACGHGGIRRPAARASSRKGPMQYFAIVGSSGSECLLQSSQPHDMNDICQPDHLFELRARDDNRSSMVRMIAQEVMYFTF